MSQRWQFDEGTPCGDCVHAFYVRVECGRELHLPLADVEGLDLRVTSVSTGLPVRLRCTNETALADAGIGQHPVAVDLDCDAVPGTEQWWGPAFDRADSAGPGHVTWGLPRCADLLSEYDADGDGSITCPELPPGGGPLDRMSPGDGQVMDCSIEDASGLCGLYRIDILSGGGPWDLLANCDGSVDPGFDIYFDCADAWAAFAPLPEAVLEDLSITGACPDVTVEVTVRNIGCVDLPGGVEVRVATDCGVPDVRTVVTPGTLAPGATTRLSVPLSVSCALPLVTVTADPSDLVIECAERSTSAACHAEAGISSLTARACDCGGAVVADAGADLTTCREIPFTLTGTATLNGCGASEHRWLDGTTLVPLTAWGPGLDVTDVMSNCSVPRDYAFEVRCAGAAGDACMDRDIVSVTCVGPPTPTPMGDGSCLSPDDRAALNCGANGRYLLFMDKDTSVDTDGDGDPTNDHDIELACNVQTSYPAPGLYTFRVWVEDAGCILWVDALVDVHMFPLDPQPTAFQNCPGDPVTLDCGVSQPGTDYTWDTDVTVDSDGNTIPDDDVDATGCIVTIAYPDGTFTARSVATEDGEPACVSLATTTFTVDGAIAGPEVRNLRLARSGSALSLTWAPVVGAASYRVVRGDIGTWYGHLADDPAGIGACTVLPNAYVDSDDATPDGTARYYLVGAVACGAGVGPLGDAWDGVVFTPRPPPLPSASCP